MKFPLSRSKKHPLPVNGYKKPKPRVLKPVPDFADEVNDIIWQLEDFFANYKQCIVMPFASIWLGLGLALTSILGNYRLTLKTCTVPGTQQTYPCD